MNHQRAGALLSPLNQSRLAVLLSPQGCYGLGYSARHIQFGFPRISAEVASVKAAKMNATTSRDSRSSGPRTPERGEGLASIWTALGLIGLVLLGACTSGDSRDADDGLDEGITTSQNPAATAEFGRVSITADAFVVGSRGQMTIELTPMTDFVTASLHANGEVLDYSPVTLDVTALLDGTGKVRLVLPITARQAGVFPVSIVATGCPSLPCEVASESETTIEVVASEPPAARSSDPLPITPALPALDRIAVDDDGATVVADEVLVLLSLDVEQPEALAGDLAAGSGAKIIGSVPELSAYQFRYVTTDAAKAAVDGLRAEAGVEVAIVHPAGYRASRVPNDYGPAEWEDATARGVNWHLQLINAPEGWDVRTDASGVDVAIIDFGINIEHPDLEPNVKSSRHFGTGKPGEHAHGSHVSGIACAKGDNDLGIAGVAWGCDLRAVDLEGYPELSVDASGVSFHVVDDGVVAIQVMSEMMNTVNAGVDVVNMSLGWPLQDERGCAARPQLDGLSNIDLERAQESNSVLRRPIDIALRRLENGEANQDILWVIAAGNECSPIDYLSPASLANEYGNVVAIAAANSDGSMAPFSNYGPSVVLAAAGGYDVLSGKAITSTGGCAETWLGLGTDCHQVTLSSQAGTSMAAPAVTGAAALYRAQYPEATVEQVVSCLTRSATAPLTAPTDTRGLAQYYLAQDVERIKLLDLGATLRCQPVDLNDQFVPLTRNGLGQLSVGMSTDDALATGLIEEFTVACATIEPIDVAILKPPYEGAVLAYKGEIYAVSVTGGAKTEPGNVGPGDTVVVFAEALRAAGFSVVIDREVVDVFGTGFVFVTDSEGDAFGATFDPATETILQVVAPTLAPCE